MGDFKKVLNDTTNQLQQSFGQAAQLSDVDHMDVSNRDGPPSCPPPSDPLQHHSAVEVIDEYMERDKRKNNLIIHNFPESNTTTRNSFNEIQDFSDMVKTEFNISEINVSKATRLKQTKPDKPRLLLITLDNLSTKRNILQQATKLRKSTTWNNVFISPDLTPKERELNRKLREELKVRKDAGEKDIYIYQKRSDCC